MERALRTAILLIFLFAGCATGGGAHVTVGTALTPAQEAGLAEVKTFVEATARAYNVPPPAIMVGDHAWDATAGAIYRRGVIVFTTSVLTSPSRDKVTAHELGHYVLRHDQPSSRTPEEREHQANIEAVHILQVGKGMSEEAALREVVAALTRTHRAVKAGSAITRGHAHPCEEIRAVVAAYPAQRAWTSTLECAPTRRPDARPLLDRPGVASAGPLADACTRADGARTFRGAGPDQDSRGADRAWPRLPSEEAGRDRPLCRGQPPPRRGPLVRGGDRTDGRTNTTMSQDAEVVFEKLMASEEAKRAYQNDPIFRQVLDAVRAHVAKGGDPLVAIGQTLASLSESRRKDPDREVARRLGAPRSTLKPWWS